MTEQRYQSLYRRYRPTSFAEIRGQDHATRALRNAVLTDRVAHAYLFSGPRGTGKTSTARVLAKALNCELPKDGEPCNACPSCIDVTSGTSFDVHELDAASNNGVDAMRDLVSRVALGSPGRWKVYIVDEVHMLSTAASNALLKTLEEPPAHVVFVLATTDPQKVLPTIKSRTQHFEFRLLDPEVLRGLMEDVSSDAELHLPDDALEAAIRKGRGSARDALTVLDQLAAGGIVSDSASSIFEIVEAICDQDVSKALTATANAISAGNDPQTLASGLIEHLRHEFLATVAPEIAASDTANTARGAGDQARRLGLPALVRSIELLGGLHAEMRDAPDTRVCLEVALVKLAHPELDETSASLIERVQNLERTLSSLQRQSPEASAPDHHGGRADSARKVLLQTQRPRTETPPQPAPREPTKSAQGAPKAETPASQASGSPSSSAALPTRDEIVIAWADHVLPNLSGRARALFRAGRFVSADDGITTFALPDAVHRSRCELFRSEVEKALCSHFRTPVQLKLAVDEATHPKSRGKAPGDQQSAHPASTENTPPQNTVSPSEHDNLNGISSDPDEPEESLADIADEPETSSGHVSAEERLLQAFPGAKEI